MELSLNNLLIFLAINSFSLSSLSCESQKQNSDTEQVADLTYEPTVEKPTYTNAHPEVLFDEAHNNFHTSSGRYKPFADLISSDGYRFTPNKSKFSKKIFEGYDILVISNAMGGTTEDDPDSVLARPAFTEDEADAVRDWVQGGGSLLLIADHAPVGAAAQILAKRFGVEMSNVYTYDKVHADSLHGKYNIAFTRENKLLADHPITRGRTADEQVNKVVTFVGQSLKGPQDSLPLLLLSNTAMDFTRTRGDSPVSAAGRSQAIALKLGEGRVIVLGEAAMLTAQESLRDGKVARFGMSYEGCDNRQFALNVMHWLSKLI